jgi:transposase InsO family protein
LRRHQLIELRRRRKRRDEFRRWERERPMQLWQMDVMGGVLLQDATELKVLTGVDDHSRFCIAAGLVRRATSKAVSEVLIASMRRYGIPDEILTDNGKCFTGRFGPRPVEVLFDRILRENGISHRHTGIRSPTTTGKIERFHQSLRKEFLDGKTFASLQQAQRELDAWVADYNTVPRRLAGRSRGAALRRIHPPIGGGETRRSLVSPAGIRQDPAPGRESPAGLSSSLGRGGSLNVIVAQPTVIDPCIQGWIAQR